MREWLDTPHPRLKFFLIGWFSGSLYASVMAVVLKLI